MNAQPRWNQERLDVLRNEIGRFLKRWIELQEEQLGVLRRLESALDSSPDSTEEAPDEILRALRVVFPGAADPSLEAAIEISQDASSEPAPLTQAEDVESPATTLPAQTADAPDRSLLILASGSFRAAFPWSEVTRFLLVEEWSGDTPHSLRQLAPESVKREDVPILESYLVSWNRNGGETALACERIEGVCEVANAAESGVEVVLRPRGPALDSDALIDYASSDEPAEAEAVPCSAAPASLTFAAAPHGAPIPAESPVAARVLLAVHYLPAQIGLARAFRARGIEVLEEPDLDRIAESLALRRFDLVCVEATPELSPNVLSALKSAQSEGVRIVAVYSRVRGTPTDPLASLGAIARLHHPFADSELAQVVDSIRVDLG